MDFNRIGPVEIILMYEYRLPSQLNFKNPKFIAYTVGYAGRKLRNFIKLLEEHGITILVDVRSFPVSKNPEFRKENLEIALPKYAIRYVHLGGLLGGYRREGYEKYMESDDYKRGISKLIEWISAGEIVVIMCMEKNVNSCHRRYITKSLESSGIKVIHL